MPTELLCICHYTYRWVQCSVLCTRSLSKHFIWFVFFVCFVVLLCLPSSSAPVCFYLRSHVAGSMLKCMRMRRWTRSTRLWQMMKLFIRARSPHTYAMHADEEMYPWHEPPRTAAGKIVEGDALVWSRMFEACSQWDWSLVIGHGHWWSLIIGHGHEIGHMFEACSQ